MKMRNKLIRRLTSTACAFAMLFSSISSVPLPVRADTQDTISSSETETELCHQSFELHPNGEEAEQVITLDGLMPEGATAEAVDVSSEHDGIAAYDITITDGEDEYQPGEENPILVEITDPTIPESGNIGLWHIRDDGSREQITDFTLENGKISFYAEAFSVYEIVKEDDVKPIVIEGSGWKKLTDKNYLKNNGSEGFYISASGDSGRFAKNSVTENIKNTEGRTGLSVTNLIKDKSDKAPNNSNVNGNELIENAVKSGASLYYFEPGADDTYYVCCKNASGVSQYVQSKKSNTINSLTLVADKNQASLWKVQQNSDGFSLYDSNTSLYWNNTYDPGKPYGFAAYTASQNFYIWQYIKPAIETDNPYKLNGKTYGLMNFTGGTHGYALMADSADKNVHSLIELVTHQSENAESITLYVDEGDEVTRWTFHSVGADNYKLSADTGSGTKYLAVDGNDLILTDSADTAASFKVTPDSGSRVQLSCDGKYVSFSMTDDGENTSTSFALSTDGGAGTWLDLLGFASLSDSDLITYSADRISVSDVKDGQKVIIYTRLWDETNKKYDMYAVDFNGTLYPCYASGGKILWLGDGTGSLEWEFTEYVDEVTKQPNYYYELYNPYSEKYIAPQLTNDQILSENTIGINMQGRRNGEFYSEIVAWDETHYAYIGMRPNEEKTKLVPCSQSTSVPFYFATLEPLNLSDKLHEVPTVDNTVHGITMKMIDFTGTSGGTGATQQNNYIVNTTYQSENQQKGLLSSSLDRNGYPVATESNLSLSSLYSGSQTVNHLFIDSVYNSSGYFEFDSTQNFATLKETNDNNFKVYRELGTVDGENKSTLKHGQFFPYNTISAGNYSTDNPTNLYNTDARTGESNANVGKLSENDPRKYEKLYSVGHKKGENGKDQVDYYFGMEMSANFVQTVSGLDAWGHDIIFEFKGDDDFWLYVDNELVIDLGGIHSALSGKVNFRTGEVEVNGDKTTLKEMFRSNLEKRGVADIESKLDEIFEDNGSGQYIFKDYTTHSMRVFYMERGAGASNLYMRFNIASVTPGRVVVSKTISGEGADVLDTDFLEYPFQIYYTLPEGEDGQPGAEHLLSNDEEHICVTYQNSNQPVTFLRKYRPPGVAEEDAYHNIYFINPTKNAEISFPDNTISYRLVECAVDSTVYNKVLINGEEVEGIKNNSNQNLISYSSKLGTAEEKPRISFNNFVKDNVIKDLYITKKLLDENNQEITDDPATFSFRLYLSSVTVNADDMTLANMYKYYVLSPNKKMCRFDPDSMTFSETSLSYSRDTINSLNEGTVEGVSADDVTFKTSGFGAISGIPSGYTIVVPGLPVGSIFKVTENVKTGYGLEGYQRVMGEKIKEDNTSEEIPSYLEYDDNPLNVGKVRAEENPQMVVLNKKGYGLTVKKKWSDLNITTSHSSVYTAVYVDGELLENSVRQIKAPATSAYYFWTKLKPYDNGSERTSLDDYIIKEVKLSKAEPTVAADGTVTDYGTVTPLNDGDSIELTATRTASATPQGESPDKVYEYVASYDCGAVEGSSRTDTVTNTRKGGAAVRLFKWDSDEPLKDGTFTLTDSEGNTIGTYTSGSDGIVTMMYSFVMEEPYTLTQTAAPKGYVGLQKTVKFVIHEDETVSLLYDNGTTPWGQTDTQDLRWANGKNGSGGIVAYVDVYNKPFNFKIAKMDGEDSSINLGGAHFALYKQENTSISGYVKNKEPMTGFEDMVTVDGTVDVCGGNSGRTIKLGAKDSVFFLTETKAPFNYTPLTDDIIFKITPLGVPSLISDSYNGQLIETDDSYIYTLSVPNTKKNPNLKLLTIEKQVKGAFGDKSREFNFTITFTGAGTGDGFKWAKNSEEQSAMARTGGTFTMKHHDRIEINLPPDVSVTVTEESTGYDTTFKLGDGATEAVLTKTFSFTDSVTLCITNTLEGSLPLGTDTQGMEIRTITLIAVPVIPIICCILYYRRRRRNDE